jgi:ribokinase
MAELLVAGSLHLDVVVQAPALPRPDQTVTGQGVAYRFGGKGGNQAVAAARMGARVAMAGAVGTDSFAAPLLAGLDAAGVDRGQVVTVPGASGMSVAVVLPGGGYGAVIVSGANLAIRAESVVFPSGCRALLMQNEIPAAVNLALARRARAAGLRVVLNAAPARAADPVLFGLVDLLVVNRGEAADILGQSESALDAPAAARALRTMGPGAVIVTLAADGLSGNDGTGFSLPARPVAVVSSHGAGDAFLGALCAEWLRGGDLRTAAGFGQTAAALTVATPPEARGEITAAAVRRALR